MRVLLVLACVCFVLSRNERPIVGILSMPSEYASHPGDSFLPASYVKFLEQGGARVVPIPYDLSPSNLSSLLASINGALFTGGAAAFFDAKTHAPTQYALTAQAVFNEVVSAAAQGETFPLWGTCLGHELIGVIAAGLDYSTSPLTPGWDSENVTLPVVWSPAGAQSRLWGPAPAVRAALAGGNVAFNAHTSGFSPANFAANAKLSATFDSLGTSADRGGRVFVAAMEGKSLPVYSTQWHPEKVAYEWSPANTAINHSYAAVEASFYPAAWFVEQARANNRAFASVDDENAALIYQYAPVFAPPAGLSSMFEQIYFFPAA